VDVFFSVYFVVLYEEQFGKVLLACSSFRPQLLQDSGVLEQCNITAPVHFGPPEDATFESVIICPWMA
jgi:hypothetical protein